MTLIAKEKSISLFPNKYIKAKLDNFKLDSIPEKRQVILGWQEAIKNGSIHKTKEEALQADFLNKFFGDVLDYAYDMGKGKWNLSKEQKTDTDNTKADGALGFFTPDSQDVRVVIELKDANTDLDKPQNRKNDKRSPVEQAFSYSSKSGGKCKWVIVSNFVEIRLYHSSDQSKYELFKIEELLKLDELKRFLFLLSKERLIAEKGDSEIDTFFAQRQAEEDLISKEFYKEFKEMRSALFEHLKTYNPNVPDLLLFEKTQKFLDRFIFCCFCEDMAIIPRWTFRGILKQYRESVLDPSDDKLWRTVKGLFRSIDEGNPRADINKFNGGLFAKDEDLDNLIVKDSLLEKLLTLEKYDFESDLNVNILGHIFEQSISDIEEIKAQIEGKEADKKTGKRKKDGIYYTPAYITKYIVEQTVGRWLEDRKQELGFDSLPKVTQEEIENANPPDKKKKPKRSKNYIENFEFWTAYKEKLSSIKILDPACGSGAFLNQAFDYLYAEHERVNEKISELKAGQRDVFENLTRLILKNNLYGVDLNEESVQITKLSLWLKTANKNSELTTLDDNIKCGNSLIDDPEIAGDKAFKWEEEFKEIFKNGGFDVVIGNPPYVRQELLSPYKPYFEKNYEVYHGVCDLYTYFIEKGQKLLSKGGYYGIIVANKWMRANYGEALRKFLKERVRMEELIDFGDLPVFEDITTYPCILIYTNNEPSSSFNAATLTTLEPTNLKESIEAKKIGIEHSSLDDKAWNLGDTKQTELLQKIKSKGIPLGEYVEGKVYRGILTGFNEAFVIDEETRQKLIKEDPKSEEIIKPFLAGREVKCYSIDWQGNYLIWTYVGVPIEKYPAIFNHLKKYQEQLEKRWDKGNYWWELRACAYYKEFENPKIVYPEVAIRSSFTFDKNAFYGNKTTFIIPVEDNYLLATLNSKVVLFCIDSISSVMRGGYYMFSSIYVEQLPIPNIPLEEQKPFIEKADVMLEKNKELQEVKKKFIKLLQNEFKIGKLSQKLEKWNELDWSEFEKELQKLKIKLSLAQKKEWMEFFESEKKIANEIQALINKTDREIDSMVYKLYELTDEEIAIVEGKG